MAAASTLRGAQVFGQCGVDPPRFSDRLGAMDLFEAWQGAAQAVQQLDAAVSSLPEQAGLQGTMQSCCEAQGICSPKSPQSSDAVPLEGSFSV